MRSFQLPKHLQESRALPDLWDGSPVDLEIGCGVGLHSIQRSLQFPERKLIAIEHTRIKFEKFNRRIQNHRSLGGKPELQPELQSELRLRSQELKNAELGNLIAVHGNAISWVANHVPLTALDQIFILYPNPNPKRRSQRWFNMPFMGRLLESLKEEGLLHLATNEEFYISEAKTLAVDLWGLQIVRSRQLRRGDQYRTHFEKKYLERGETCFDLTLQKKRRLQ